MELTKHAEELLKKSYYQKDAEGKVIENWEGLCRRVANHLAKGDYCEKYRLRTLLQLSHTYQLYNRKSERDRQCCGTCNIYENCTTIKAIEDKFYDLLYNQYFIVNTPSLMNSGTELGGLSACFTVNVPDSMEGILQAIKDTGMTLKTGGGVGISLSKLRSKGAKITSTCGESSGIISWLNIFNTVVEEVKQGGRRRGAMLATLPINHPQILEFIACKNSGDRITNFNLSVGITDEFMRKVKNDENYDLVEPHNGKVVNSLNAREVFNSLCESAWKTGDPGILFLDTINKDNPIPKTGEILSSNPCLAGETLVAVADGRQPVTIKQLAEEGLDVQVHAVDNIGRPCVRLMRNPRITGQNIDVYRVSLDDGTFFDVTNNHKFLTVDGDYKEVSKINLGDSLHVGWKMEASIKDIFPKSNSNSQDYYWIKQGGRETIKAEHRLIYESFGNTIPKGFVVHHKDFNAKNNNINNLECMSKEAHDFLHGDRMRGANNPIHKIMSDPIKSINYRKKRSELSSGINNPMYIDISNDDICSKVKNLILSKGHRLSLQDYIEEAKKLGLPTGFTEYRKKELGSTVEFLDRMAKESAIEYRITNPKIVKHLQRMLAMGYDAKIINNNVVVKRICEECSNIFWVAPDRREACFCSNDCKFSYQKKDTERTLQLIDGTQKAYKKRGKENKIQQIRVFNDLKFKLGRVPLRKEWEKECKGRQIPFRFHTLNSFKNYADLRDGATLFNHKVISITYVGKQTVYNGTVDDFHNFYIVGKESVSKYGKKQWVMLNNKQCGEFLLPPYNSCTLGAVNLSKIIDMGEWENGEPVARVVGYKNAINYKLFDSIISTAVRMLDNTITMNKFPIPEIEEVTLANRPIGLGFLNLSELFIKLGLIYGSDESLEMAETITMYMRKKAIETSIELAKERGAYPNFDAEDWYKVNHKYIPYTIINIPVDMPVFKGIRNSTVLSIAPNGSTGVIVNASSGGVEPIFAVSYKRKTVDCGDMHMVNPLFEEMMFPPNKESIENTLMGSQQFERDKILSEIEDNAGSVKGVYGVPVKIQELFVTAREIPYEQHIKMQAAVQNHTDLSISKTVGMSEDATVDDVKNAYIMAHKLHCKGITIYRDGSRENQVLSTKKKENKEGDKIEGESKFKIKEGSELNTLLDKWGKEDASKVMSKEESDKISLVDEETFEDDYDYIVEPRERRDVVVGYTYKISLHGMKIYIIINFNEDEMTPIEIFILAGKPGDDINAIAQSIGRLVSLSLKFKVPFDEIIQQLDSMAGDEVVWIGGDKILSIPDAVAKALKWAMKKRKDTVGSQPVKEVIKEIKTDKFQKILQSSDYPSQKDLGSLFNKNKCPNCGDTLVFQEGCKKCLSCDYNKCG